MWKEKLMNKGLTLLVLIVLSLTISMSSLPITTIYGEPISHIKKYTNIVICKLMEDDLDSLVTRIVDIFEKRLCRMNVEELYVEGLTAKDIAEVEKFCSLFREAKVKIMHTKIKSVRDTIIISSLCECGMDATSYVNRVGSDSTCSSLGACSGNINVYSCGITPPAFNIPCPRILGITICNVVRMPMDCCIPGQVQCLWGCENADPTLGFGPEGKPFSSVGEFRNYVESRSYYESVFSYPERGIYDFTRNVGYGYRYEAWYVQSQFRGYSEGPEPNPDPNWYGYLNGFWPLYTYQWHITC
ncbi:MAG: hypothetical protein RMI79_00415 [Nitrososphaerota archaeon]|nr:hypothetical protein [Nitrososphaerota archaeon]